MAASKYATVAEDDDGGVHLFRGQKDVEFSYVKMSGDGDGDAPTMERVTFERRALLHLPEPMDSDEFKEFSEGRKIGDVVRDCLGQRDGGDSA